jgi:hypothetical protein
VGSPVKPVTGSPHPLTSILSPRGEEAPDSLAPIRPLSLEGPKPGAEPEGRDEVDSGFSPSPMTGEGKDEGPCFAMDDAL